MASCLQRRKSCILIFSNKPVAHSLCQYKWKWGNGVVHVGRTGGHLGIVQDATLSCSERIMNASKKGQNSF